MSRHSKAKKRRNSRWFNATPFASPFGVEFLSAQELIECASEGILPRSIHLNFLRVSDYFDAQVLDILKNIFDKSRIVLDSPWAGHIAAQMGWVTPANSLLCKTVSTPRIAANGYRALYGIDDEMNGAIALAAWQKPAKDALARSKVVAMVWESDDFFGLDAPHGNVALQLVGEHQRSRELYEKVQKASDDSILFLYYGADLESGCVILQPSEDYSFLLSANNPALVAMNIGRPIYNRLNETRQCVEKKGRVLERNVQAQLHAQLGGNIEVATPAGRIDLLTETHIIEIKTARNWKSGIGQIATYSAYYPSHIKTLAVFGSCDPGTRGVIESQCEALGIELWWV